MKLIIHDYCGHPFPVQLSRELARRGHDVLSLSCPSFVTPKGAVALTPDDPPSLQIEGLSLEREFNKYQAFSRLSQEREYGAVVSKRTLAFNPDVVISANTPLLAQRALQRACRHNDIPFIFWLQDVLGVGIRNVLVRRHKLLAPLGDAFVRLERRLLRNSSSVVAISDDFRDVMKEAGVSNDSVTVIENWAALDEVPVRARQNGWRSEHGLGDRTVLLYAGTLGLKHDPQLLVRLAIRLRDRSDVRVVVASEGPGADWLRDQIVEHSLDNLSILGFQPYGRLPEMLGAADVLLVLLEPDASIFSVPSKVLTNLCAGRPILASVPLENLAARVLEQSGGGLVADPREAESFVSKATRLVEDETLRRRLGHQARAYAERTFDIESIATRFERLFEEHAGRPDVAHIKAADELSSI